MKYTDWLNEAHNKTNDALKNCINNYHLDGWSENHITTQAMKSLESIGLEIDWADKPQKVKWEGFKLKGKLETSFGDIAVIAKVWITSDRFIEGVAFYEAKRQFFDDEWNAKGFASIKQDQLSRISLKTHASNVLLYDIDLESEKACATSVPTIFVSELAEANLASSSGRLLHYYGDLWVKAIGRNLLGMDLDFRKESVESIKKLASENNKPFVMLNVAVAKTRNLELKLDDSFIDMNAYEKWIRPKELEADIEKKPRNNGPSFDM